MGGRRLITAGREIAVCRTSRWHMLMHPSSKGCLPWQADTAQAQRLCHDRQVEHWIFLLGEV